MDAETDAGIRAVFEGRRGRLLAALLFAEFGAAVQALAFSSVLPVASSELNGERLYGAALGAGWLTTILVMGIGLGRLTRIRASRMLGFATSVHVTGVALAVAGPDMSWIVAGEVIRGAGTGLLAGFSLTAIGALYPSSIRPRVLGMFALVWFVPSALGPAVNSVIAEMSGWRAAYGWPVLLIVAARLSMGRHLDLVPWTRPKAASVQLRLGGGLVAGVSVAAVAPLLAPMAGSVVLVSGAAMTAIMLRRILAARVPGERRRADVTTLLILSIAYFGGVSVVPLGVVEVLGLGIPASSWAVGVGSAAWALTGVRVPTRGGSSRYVSLGMILAATGLVVIGVAFAGHGGLSYPAVLAGSVIAGTGMGLAYPHLTSRPMDGLGDDAIATVAVALTLTDTVGAALGPTALGSAYGLASALEVDVAPVLLGGCLVAASLLLGAAARHRRAGTLQ